MRRKTVGSRRRDSSRLLVRWAFCGKQLCGGPSGSVNGDSVNMVTGNRNQSSEHTALTSMAQDMIDSVFCLTPAGDTQDTSRLFSAVAAGCLPVLIYHEKHGIPGPFSDVAKYDEWRVRWKHPGFLRNPKEAINRLRQMDLKEIRLRQHRMEEHAADILYEHPQSRVGENFLIKARECLQRRAANL